MPIEALIIVLALLIPVAFLSVVAALAPREGDTRSPNETTGGDTP
jgi:hypothetical protein